MKLFCSLLLLSSSDALRLSVSRRAAALGAAFAACPPAFSATCEDAIAGEATWVEGRQTQGTGKFVANFDAAVTSRDPAAVKSALQVLKLPSGDDAVAAALDHKGSAAGHVPTVTEITTGLTSAKVSVRVENACMTPRHYIRFLYMKEPATGKVFGVRELTKLDPRLGGPEIPEMVKATVPKGTTVVPCAYCVPFGLFEGEAFQT
jgi:desulfoferrodoxin (superoxide reductase-like protein)